MSTSSTSKCLFCVFVRSTQRIPSSTRKFSTSSSKHFKRLPALQKRGTSRAGINVVPKLPDGFVEEKYTPEQRAAIKAADNVVKHADVQKTGKRIHPWTPDLYDEFHEVDAVVDHPVKTPWQNLDENSRLKSDDELTQDLYKLMHELPDDKQKAAEAWREFDKNMRLTVGKEEAELKPRSATAPDLPSLTNDNSKQNTSAKSEDGRSGPEPSPALLRLMQMTGLTQQGIAKLRVKTIIMHRVTNQTRLGKIDKQYYLSVAGNGDGLVGIGEGKSDEAAEAMIQSQYRAIRNMRPILRYEGRTIFGDVDGKVSATELQLYARPPGFGLRCQQYIFELCRAAGISDIAARVTRSRNPMNTVKAAFQALLSQKDPEEIAKARGKKMVDVRKVYYAGRV